MKKIFITGSEGFIGSHLIEDLVKNNYSVKGLVQYNSFNNWGWIDTMPKKILKEVELVHGDIRDADFIRNNLNNVKCVLNLAALIGIPYSYHAPSSYFNTNVMGLMNILNACKDKNISIIHTSTSEVYGTAIKIPIDENHPLQAQSPYSASKISADHLALSYFNSFDMDIKIIRPFNTFGPRQSLRAVIPSIITQLSEKNKKLNIGSITPTRDLTYIDDTVRAFRYAINNSKIIGQVINLGTGYEISIKNLINLIAEIMGIKNLKIKEQKNRLRPKNSEVFRLVSNNNKAKEFLGWTPNYSKKSGLKKGLIKTVEWYLDSKNTINFKKDIYNL